MSENIEIPVELLPEDGRFGSGPSRTRYEALEDFGQVAASYVGTSHRQAGVRRLVGLVRQGLLALLDAPEGYEVMLGNGGSTYFWDSAVFSLIERRSQHLSFGEFGGKFAKAVAAAPFLEDPSVRSAEPGSAIEPLVEDDIDAYCWPQNETSTGVAVPVRRVPADGALTVIDATSAAAGLPVDLGQTDCYYFAPQKGFAGEGGLWVAVVSPAAIDRTERIAAGRRYVPPSLDLKIALDNSRKDQTYNTPSVYTLFMLAHQVDWLLAQGGQPWITSRVTESSSVLYGWAESSAYATPFVQDPALRSPVIGTIDLDPAVDAKAVTATLRANGILDTEPYRGLARNQLRIGMFVSTPPSDVEALTRCIDYVVERLG
ncbi:phosphoserine transaminase [Cumulibacter manganitolerans]|uniref:phosphoserine transaminase n=1 Tax=Cumulibacter manganitolerans TaxID=1884992 RepID=UPI00129730BB|nr:phosphoserine transaminase [Cumulibacter manganitolerans]